MAWHNHYIRMTLNSIFTTKFCGPITAENWAQKPITGESSMIPTPINCGYSPFSSTHRFFPMSIIFDHLIPMKSYQIILIPMIFVDRLSQSLQTAYGMMIPDEVIASRAHIGTLATSNTTKFEWTGLWGSEIHGT